MEIYARPSIAWQKKESFGNIGPQLSEKYSNMDRISAGVGYRVNTQWSIAFDFTLQGSRTGQDQEYSSSDLIYQIKGRRFLSKGIFKTKRTQDYAD